MEIIWQYCENLSFPTSAEEVDTGEILISDTGNNRVILVDREKRIVNQLEIQKPYSAHKIKEGYLITSEKGVFIYDFTKTKLLWEYLDVKNPIDAIFLKDSILISNYGKNEVIKVDINNKKIVWRYGPEFSSTEKILYHMGRRFPPSFFPYKISLTDEGVLLAVEKNPSVVEIDWEKKELWRYGIGVEESSYNCVRFPYMAIKVGSQKYASYIIADGGDSRIIEVNRQKHLIWQLGGGAGWVGDVQFPFLKKPVHIQFTKTGNLLVTDNCFHRVFEIKYPILFTQPAKYFMLSWNQESTDQWQDTWYGDVANFSRINVQIKNNGAGSIKWRLLGSQSAVEDEWIQIKEETILEPGNSTYFFTTCPWRFIKAQIISVIPKTPGKVFIWVTCGT